ncbi:MAG: hypothetical protein N2319_05795 [Candidatus Kapabacteria bacterium]|nr:hypothetical protein [Candidatus Kapabacteria bacterium]
MLLIIINYTVRALIVILGIIFVTGILNSYLSFPSDFKAIMPMMGVIFILWGVYRLITYHSNLRRYRNNEDNDEN